MTGVNIQQGEHWWDLTVTITPGGDEITASKPDPWAEITDREAGG
jgi:hypothetical protein